MEVTEGSKERGRAVRMQLAGDTRPRSVANAAGMDMVDGLEDFVLGMNFGEIWARPHLNIKERCILVLAMLTAMGREPQIRPYVGYALTAGWKAEEINEVFVQAIPYAGLPSAFNGLRIASEVYAERGIIVRPADH